MMVSLKAVAKMSSPALVLVNEGLPMDIGNDLCTRSSLNAQQKFSCTQLGPMFEAKLNNVIRGNTAVKNGIKDMGATGGSMPSGADTGATGLTGATGPGKATGYAGAGALQDQVASKIADEVSKVAGPVSAEPVAATAAPTSAAAIPTTAAPTASALSTFSTLISKEYEKLAAVYCAFDPSGKRCFALKRGVTESVLCKQDAATKTFTAVPSLSAAEMTACASCDDKTTCASLSNADLQYTCGYTSTNSFCPTLCGLTRCGGAGAPSLSANRTANSAAPSFAQYLNGIGQGLKAWIDSGDQLMGQLADEVVKKEQNGATDAAAARLAYTQVLGVWDHSKTGLKASLSSNQALVGNLCSNGAPTDCSVFGTAKVMGYRSAGCQCQCRPGYTGAKCGEKIACSVFPDCTNSLHATEVSGNRVDGCKCDCTVDYEGDKCTETKCRDKFDFCTYIKGVGCAYFPGDCKKTCKVCKSKE
jgi:hypothetical protein